VNDVLKTVILAIVAGIILLILSTNSPLYERIWGRKRKPPTPSS